MLINLIKHIEHALVSYVKMIEDSQDHLIFNDDLACLLASSKNLKEHRRRDLLSLHTLCKIALEKQQSPAQCIQSLFNHIMQMYTGFLFFPGDSKLKICILQAIEQYDIRYIQWRKGVPSLVKHIHSISVRPSLKASPEGLELYEEKNAQAPEAVQHQIDTLINKIESQHQIVRQHDETFDSMREIISELKQILQDTRRELSETRMENITLQEKLYQLTQPMPKQPEDSHKELPNQQSRVAFGVS